MCLLLMMLISSHRCLGHLFDQYLTELMLEAGREDKKIAINNKRDHQGIPAVTVATGFRKCMVSDTPK